ncbi:MAG: ATP-dependent RNA helicase HrpA, partial [Verrucomicrobiales bacterium]
MAEGLAGLNYPETLPVVERREEILKAVREHQVVVVVSETGSGKTTQLPKMVAEVLAMQADTEDRRGKRPRLIGCTQPRRLAASSVAERVAEELEVPLGGFVGYQVRFDDKTSRDTRIKFMTDGILLAETQGDPNLGRYGALILDEAHERSLNIDFLLGYLKRLLDRRPDLKLVISSATLDAGSFVEFFSEEGKPAVLVEAEGRTFPVEEHFLPPWEDEDLSDHVVRAVDWLSGVESQGDVLVFLPGEKEIRDCAEALEERRYLGTEILPLFARLGLGDQQRVFHPGAKRRIVLATNVAETSLTIPRIVCVIDSGLARVSRWSPGRGVQRLQIEPVSQASARQRKGRCGRVREGVCVRLYGDEDLGDRPEFTDPEIRRSSLAGVILQMKSLGLPEIEEFPFIDPPAPKAVSEGYRALREVGALERDRSLTESGRKMSRMPIDPRLARMLIAAEDEGCLSGVLPIVAGLETQDVRERPAEKAKEADAAHKRWKHEDSDFLTMLKLWDELQSFRKGRRWHFNRLRKFCRQHFLNLRRVTEWANVHDELVEVVRRVMKSQLSSGPCLPMAEGARKGNPGADALHRALLAGVPKQFGLWDREEKAYRGAMGGQFAIFPGSMLFGGKRWDWVMAMELVDTTRLWARRVAKIDPAWIEDVAPHLCRRRYSEGRWDPGQGAVYAKETVLCSGLPIITGRKVHFGRIDPQAARAIFIREGLMQGGVKGESRAVRRLAELREKVEQIEHKLRRRGGLWSEDAVVAYFERCLPEGLCTAKAYHRWRKAHEDEHLPELADVVWEDLSDLDLSGYPDEIECRGEVLPVYYHCAPGERDDGVTF